MATKRATRNDYAPSVRARAARQDGLRRLTPGYLDDLSDTKFLYFNDPGASTTRQTIATPSTGHRLRLIRVSINQTASDSLHFAELYFGTGTTIATNASKAIDFVRVPDLSEGTSRTWSRGTGPVGAKNEVLSLRWTSAPTTQHQVIIEYTEER